MSHLESMPVSCEDLQEMVSAYCDDELTDEDCAHLQEHIALCETCSSAYRSGRLLKELIRRSCRSESAPASLRVQILTRISAVRVEER